jgi:hypothetical protein
MGKLTRCKVYTSRVLLTCDSGEERWRSEGIQVGGLRANRGVIGTWVSRWYKEYVCRTLLIHRFYHCSLIRILTHMDLPVLRRSGKSVTGL